MMASSFAKALGIKQSKTGAAIGGAIGSFVPIPGGAAIGGLIGGTIGGLFKTTKHGGAFDGRRLQTLDPDGVLEANLQADRIVRCVVYPAAAVPAPRVHPHVEAVRSPGA